MAKLSHLLILIGDRLKLLDNSLAVSIDQTPRRRSGSTLSSHLDFTPPKLQSFLTSLYALRQEVGKARDFCKRQRIHQLYDSLEQVATSILNNSAVKKEFANSALRLLPLKDELGKFILTITIHTDRQKLGHLLLSVEHDLEEIRERAQGDRPLVKAIHEFFSLASQARKDLEKAIPEERELDVMRRFSSMCNLIRNILLIIRNSSVLEESVQIQALRKVLLHDWNKMISLLKDRFEQIYRQKLQRGGVFLSSRREGVEGFELLS